MQGKVVKDVRPMTQEEMDREGWDRPATVVEFTDGSLLYPSRDSEGNGPGALFGFVDGQTLAFS